MIEERIKTIVLQELKIEPADYSEELAVGDLPQWDSFAHMNLLMATEKAFNLTFDIVDSVEIETVADLIELVKRYQENSNA